MENYCKERRRIMCEEKDGNTNNQKNKNEIVYKKNRETLQNYETKAIR